MNPTDHNICPTCGRIHITATKHPACAGHLPCRRRPHNGHGDYCTQCAPLASTNAVLGPVTARPVTNPLEALSNLAGRMQAWLDVAHRRLEQAPSFGDGTELRSEVRAFNAIASRLGYLLSVMARLDLDERLIRLDRIQADQLREVLEAVMRDPLLELTAEQQLEWPRAFARAARARVAPSSSVPGVLTVDGEVT